MNIYQRQMKELGLNLDQYSKFLDIPKSITKKIINGNGEVVEDMEINNFLRKNLFGKHQEVENNKEEKKVEALGIKLRRGQNNFDSKRDWLLKNYPNSKEVLWYIYEYNKKEYFAKHGIQNKADLMRRYTFTCNTGRLKGLKDVGISTIDRLVNKQYDELGINTAYPLICQLYDCLELGNIKAHGDYKPKYDNKIQIENKEEEQKLKDWFYNFNFKDFCDKHEITTTQFALDIKTSGSTVKAIKKGTYKPSMTLINRLYDYVNNYNNSNVETDLAKWFKQFDFEKFVNEKSILYKDIAEAINVPYGSIYPMKKKTYIPNEEILKKLKNYVDSFDNKYETQTVTMEQAKVFNETISDEDIMKLNNDFITLPNKESDIEIINNNEDLLRNLLKDRLTEEEKTLIRIFGGRI